MNADQDTVLRISPGKAEITVEQNVNGIISRKNITPETLGECLLGSRYNDTVFDSGMLPENCVGVQLTQRTNTYFIRYPDLFADISYYGTVYEHFPLPRLVFRFKLEKESGKVTDLRLCVVKDERLRPETPTFYYPFPMSTGTTASVPEATLSPYTRTRRVFLRWLVSFCGCPITTICFGPETTN